LRGHSNFQPFLPGSLSFFHIQNNHLADAKRASDLLESLAAKWIAKEASACYSGGLMKFARDTSYDSAFASISDIRWYPYVGLDFGSHGRRIMVYAHNIPIKPAEYEARLIQWKDPAHWADRIEPYAYESKWWSEAFRYFIKAAVGLQKNYKGDSSPEVLERVDSFIRQIAYLNFIQDLVKSDKALASATWEQAKVSRLINREILKTLKITHCICWGKPTYEHVKAIPGFTWRQEKQEARRSFSSCVVDAGDGHSFHLLRIFHPSMPKGLAPYSEATQKIIADFLNR